MEELASQILGVVILTIGILGGITLANIFRN